ncbi:MAG: response regulator [Planctomycetaceae bacterium]|nr:response regulator [Planctomycetaceae bacterium]
MTNDTTNILLVDDQPSRLLSYEVMLNDLGANLIKAGSGNEALQMLMKDEFAVILLDVNMPGMDGFETATMIHQHPRFEQTPIIFVTGAHITDLDRLHGYKLGAVDYVYVPVVPEILRSKVAVLVELHRKKQELQRANDKLAEANHALQTEIAVQIAVQGQLRLQAEITANMAEGVLLIRTSDTAIVYANSSFEEMFGYGPGELSEQPMLVLNVPTERTLATIREMTSTLEQGDVWQGELLNVRKDGSQFWSLAKVSAFDHFQHGRVWLKIHSDITDLKSAQQRALQAERLAAIGEMITGLAHESRNALQGSQGCLYRLAWRLEDRPEALDLVRRAQQELERLDRLLEDVRGYVAPINLSRTECDLAGIWREAWSTLTNQLVERDVSLQEQLARGDLRCSVDRFRLEQVFRNILDNALAACADPVRITIQVSQAELDGQPAVRIAIRDNGPGLSAEQRRKIFDAFFTTKKRGTGLGMSICKRIIEAHDGQIAVGPDGPGAEILITLPRSEA